MSVMSNVRPAPDHVLVDIADYVQHYQPESTEAYQTAHYCLLDSIGCALEALQYPACTNLLGRVVTCGTTFSRARVMGSLVHLDLMQAPFYIVCLFRWLDVDDEWLADVWG